VTNEARSVGISSRALHARHRDPYLAILETGRNEDGDLIVMASHGRRGLMELLLGSETCQGSNPQ
jgi:nucleotide-binding universal stress UspA family protein